MIAYSGSEGGQLNITLNNISVIDNYDSTTSGFRPPEFLLKKDNKLSAKLSSTDDNKTLIAQVELFKSCQDKVHQPPGDNDNVIATITLDSVGEKEVSFDIASLPDYSYLSASVNDDTESLLKAIESMKDTIRNRDLKGYISFLEPMIKDLVLEQAPPEEMIRNMMDQLLSDQFVLKDTSALSVRAVLNGKAYEVTDKEGYAPIQFVPQGESDGMMMPDKISQSKYWIHYNGRWQVLRQ